jgi:hypothetical protein
MAQRKNRFDVQAVFPHHTFGLTSRSDVQLTPLDVAIELEAFCLRIRETYAGRQGGGTCKLPVTMTAARARHTRRTI